MSDNEALELKVSKDIAKNLTGYARNLEGRIAALEGERDAFRSELESTREMYAFAGKGLGEYIKQLEAENRKLREACEQQFDVLTDMLIEGDDEMLEPHVVERIHAARGKAAAALTGGEG